MPHSSDIFVSSSDMFSAVCCTFLAILVNKMSWNSKNKRQLFLNILNCFGISLDIKDFLLGIWYWGSTNFMKWQKPASSTIEMGCKSETIIFARLLVMSWAFSNSVQCLLSDSGRCRRLGFLGVFLLLCCFVFFNKRPYNFQVDVLFLNAWKGYSCCCCVALSCHKWCILLQFYQQMKSSITQRYVFFLPFSSPCIRLMGKCVTVHKVHAQFWCVIGFLSTGLFWHEL